MTEELNENIIGIDFIHAHKLTYDVISRKVTFAEPELIQLLHLETQSYRPWRLRW